MQCYRSSKLIQVTLTVPLQAIDRYSSAAKDRGGNLGDNVKDSDITNIPLFTKRMLWFMLRAVSMHVDL